MCSCQFTVENIAEETFSCRASKLDPNFENTVVYRAKITPQVLVSVLDANDILEIIETWVQSGATIVVNHLTLNIDPNCPTTLESFHTEDCFIMSTAAVTTTTGTTMTRTPSLPTPLLTGVDDSSKSSVGIIIGVSVASVVVVVLVVIIVVITIFHCRLKSNYR